jgi:hypothetical protein
VTFALLWLSTGIKWLLYYTKISNGPWEREQELAVVKGHMFAASEAQMNGGDFELGLTEDRPFKTAANEVPVNSHNRHLTLLRNRGTSRLDSSAEREEDRPSAGA